MGARRYAPCESKLALHVLGLSAGPQRARQLLGRVTRVPCQASSSECARCRGAAPCWRAHTAPVSLHP
jgi:hypothetical protein